jgi:hypothetical protein
MRPVNASPDSVSRTFSPPPAYDSADQPGPATGNYATPEADGRPGEYDFQLGVNAYYKQDYAHAIEMYKVAASWAYKPAEFNLGLIYFQGLGVSADKPRGAAWMSLAAERGDSRKAERARDLMLSQLGKSEVDQAFAIWQQLKPTYGDEVALHRAKMRWAQVRSSKTGSYVGDGAVHLLVSDQGESFASQARPGSDANMGSVGAPQATSGADFFKYQATDSSIAYRQFERSGNPYDVSFRSDLTGTATVGPLEQVATGNKSAITAPEPQARSKDDLASLQLFGAQSQPQLLIDLACTSRTALSSVAKCAALGPERRSGVRRQDFARECHRKRAVSVGGPVRTGRCTVHQQLDRDLQHHVQQLYARLGQLSRHHSCLCRGNGRTRAQIGVARKARVTRQIRRDADHEIRNWGCHRAHRSHLSALMATGEHVAPRRALDARSRQGCAHIRRRL